MYDGCTIPSDINKVSWRNEVARRWPDGRNRRALHHLDHSIPPGEYIINVPHSTRYTTWSNVRTLSVASTSMAEPVSDGIGIIIVLGLTHSSLNFDDG